MIWSSNESIVYCANYESRAHWKRLQPTYNEYTSCHFHIKRKIGISLNHYWYSPFAAAAHSVLFWVCIPPSDDDRNGTIHRKVYRENIGKMCRELHLFLLVSLSSIYKEICHLSFQALKKHHLPTASSTSTSGIFSSPWTVMVSGASCSLPRPHPLPRARLPLGLPGPAWLWPRPSLGLLVLPLGLSLFLLGATWSAKIDTGFLKGNKYKFTRI